MKFRRIVKFLIPIAILPAWLGIIVSVSRVDTTWLLFICMFVCAAAATLISDNLVWLIPTDDLQTQQEEFKEATDWFWALFLPLCVIAAGFYTVRKSIPPDAFYFYFFGGFIGGGVVAKIVEILARNYILQHIQKKAELSRPDRQ